ncbi:uncharacterized protein LOC126568072 isoform X2 [Anopheles maculipalpis]|uniref:uncharacterized protein LOC126568072 isoform X2 n=1 Tax=Anopheles maculipalpis TaxID=1496333 RepID=UPI0021599955|nr:uncharacterized protein LOC126568072 isoform X2 [Anopheles maculipalpis]
MVMPAFGSDAGNIRTCFRKPFEKIIGGSFCISWVSNQSDMSLLLSLLFLNLMAR